MTARRLRRSLAATIAALAFAAPATAAAFEHQWHLGLDAGWAALSGEPTLHGYGGGAHLAYGLNDTFNAMLELSLSRHPSGEALVGDASIGAAYVFDILEWVPYAGLMLSADDVLSTNDACDQPGAPVCTSTRLGLTVPLGLDYQLTRSFAVGAAVRYHMLLVGGDGTGAYLTAFARAEYVWGY